MALESLRQIVPPPTTPAESGTSDQWPKIEEELGMSLPADFKEYITVYGSGGFADFIYPFNPFSRHTEGNLLHKVRFYNRVVAEVKKEYGDEEWPYPLYPVPGSLLLWGATTNGDELFWMLEGEPDLWPVVVKETRQRVFEHHSETMTSFLAKMLSGAITSRIFTEDWLFEGPIFVQ